MYFCFPPPRVSKSKEDRMHYISLRFPSTSLKPGFIVIHHLLPASAGSLRQGLLRCLQTLCLPLSLGGRWVVQGRRSKRTVRWPRQILATIPRPSWSSFLAVIYSGIVLVSETVLQGLKGFLTGRTFRDSM